MRNLKPYYSSMYTEQQILFKHACSMGQPTYEDCRQNAAIWLHSNGPDENGYDLNKFCKSQCDAKFKMAYNYAILGNIDALIFIIENTIGEDTQTVKKAKKQLVKIMSTVLPEPSDDSPFGLQYYMIAGDFHLGVYGRYDCADPDLAEKYYGFVNNMVGDTDLIKARLNSVRMMCDSLVHPVDNRDVQVVEEHAKVDAVSAYICSRYYLTARPPKKKMRQAYIEEGARYLNKVINSNLVCVAELFIEVHEREVLRDRDVNAFVFYFGTTRVLSHNDWYKHSFEY